MAKYAKGVVASNMALALIAMPVAQTSYINDQSTMIIPEVKLDTTFNVNEQEIQSPPPIQIPVDYIYMSQGFHAFHPGIDLATKYGTSIKPIEDGTVIEAGYSPFGYGNEILIDNGNGIESLYAHLSKIEVKKGEGVTESTEIGLVGTTGHSTGPHLHLEIHKDGIPVNPLTILPPLTNKELLTLNQQ